VVWALSWLLGCGSKSFQHWPNETLSKRPKYWGLEHFSP
jgi:hypothetical protein